MLLPLKENSVDRSRLRRSLLILAALLSLLPSILLGRFELDRIASAQRKQADQETGLAAKVIGQTIEQQVDSSVRVLEALAGQVQAIGKLEPAVLQKIVTAQKGSFPVFFSMYVGDGEGSSVATDPPFDKFGTPNAGTNYKDRDYYQGIVQTRKPFIGPVRLGRRTHLPSVQIAVPVFDPQGRLRSYAAGAIDMNIISPQVEKIVSGLPGLSVVVMDPTGRVIIHPALPLGRMIKPIRTGPALESAM